MNQSLLFLSCIIGWVFFDPLSPNRPEKSLLWNFGLAGSAYSSKLKYSIGEIAQLMRSLLVSLRHLKKKSLTCNPNAKEAEICGSLEFTGQLD